MRNGKPLAIGIIAALSGALLAGAGVWASTWGSALTSAEVDRRIERALAARMEAISVERKFLEEWRTNQMTVLEAMRQEIAGLREGQVAVRLAIERLQSREGSP